MQKIKQILPLLFVALFASYYAGTTFFVHTHIDESGKVITHSHPYSSGEHSHCANTLLLINNLTTLLFIGIGIAVGTVILSVSKRLFFSFNKGYKINSFTDSNLQRGPPVWA